MWDRDMPCFPHAAADAGGKMFFVEFTAYGQAFVQCKGSSAVRQAYVDDYSVVRCRYFPDSIASNSLRRASLQTIGGYSVTRWFGLMGECSQPRHPPDSPGV